MATFATSYLADVRLDLFRKLRAPYAPAIPFARGPAGR
jgi:hypothetical protein